MRIAVLGTPDFAVPTLVALHEAGHEVALVVAQPDRPSGRGQEMRPPPMAAAALVRGLPLAQPRAMRQGPFPDRFVDLGLDAAVVVAYGRILPKRLLDAPKHGCVNLHASLLPRWRGAAPIQRAIEAGDAVTGVCAQRMVEALDEGPLYGAVREPIRPDDTSGTLHARLAVLAARLAVEVLGDLPSRVPVPQKGAVSWAKVLEKAEGRMDFGATAPVLERRVRALSPWPGAWVQRPDGPLRVRRVEVVAEAGRPGVVLSLSPLVVACGQGALRLHEVLPAGRRPMSGEDYARGARVTVGAALGGG